MKKILFAVLIVLLAAAIVTSGYLLYRNISETADILLKQNSKVVLYEAPTSLKVADDDDMITGTEIARNMRLVTSRDAHLEVAGKSVSVYETNVSNAHQDSVAMPPQSRVPVAYFDFEGRVYLKIAMDGLEINEVSVSPLAYSIKADILDDGKSVGFWIDKNDSYSVIFNGNTDRAFHIFANAIEKEKPDQNDENVIYYAPGEYFADTITLASDQTLYVSGGAVIHGHIVCADVSNVNIIGRGIIDGSLYGGNADDRNVRIPLNIASSSSVNVEGIMLLNSNGWVLQGNSSSDVVIDNVKIISSRANGDGVTLQSCKDFEVKHCFVRSWDDSLVVKNYSDSSENISFSDIQIWTDLAQSMEIGYETNKGSYEDSYIKNIVFEDITVLYNFHKPVLSIHNADSCLVSDVTYENITVERADMTWSNVLIEMVVCESSWSTTYERGDIRDVSVNGLKVLGGDYDYYKAVFSGFGKDHTVENVHLSGIEINGTQVTNGKSLLIFDIESKNTENITIGK